MKVTIFIILLLGTSNLQAQVQDKILLDLYDFDARHDSAKNCEIISYPGLNLVLHQSDTVTDLYAKSKLALSITRKGYSNMFQVFDSAFLMISIVKGVSSAAGPYNFQRDSTFLIDLSSGKVKFVNGKNFKIVSSKKMLMEFYPRTAAQQKGPNLGVCIIESIDFDKSSMVLLSRMQTTHTIPLEDVNLDFLLK